VIEILLILSQKLLCALIIKYQEHFPQEKREVSFLLKYEYIQKIVVIFYLQYLFKLPLHFDFDMEVIQQFLWLLEHLLLGYL
jgi:hypothetical protein